MPSKKAKRPLKGPRKPLATSNPCGYQEPFRTPGLNGSGVLFFDVKSLRLLSDQWLDVLAQPDVTELHRVAVELDAE